MPKSSEVKPLDALELETLRDLFARWTLCRYPYDRGSSEQSDAIQTYLSIRDEAQSGKAQYQPQTEEDKNDLQDRIKKYGEMELPD